MVVGLGGGSVRGGGGVVGGGAGGSVVGGFLEDAVGVEAEFEVLALAGVVDFPGRGEEHVVLDEQGDGVAVEAFLTLVGPGGALVGAA